MRRGRCRIRTRASFRCLRIAGRVLGRRCRCRAIRSSFAYPMLPTALGSSKRKPCRYPDVGVRIEHISSRATRSFGTVGPVTRQMLHQTGSARVRVLGVGVAAGLALHDAKEPVNVVLVASEVCDGHSYLWSPLLDGVTKHARCWHRRRCRCRGCGAGGCGCGR